MRFGTCGLQLCAPLWRLWSLFCTVVHPTPQPRSSLHLPPTTPLQTYTLLLYSQALPEIASKVSFFLFEASVILGFAQEALKYS